MEMGDLLTIEEASEFLKMNKQQLASLRFTGRGPVFRRLTPKTIRYLVADLEAWIGNSAQSSTAA